MAAALLVALSAGACASSEPAPREPAPRADVAAVDTQALLHEKPAPSPPLSSRDAAAAKLVRHYLESAGESERANTLLALDAYELPKDAKVRAQILREALARPPKLGRSRFRAELGDPPHECFVATPDEYDAALQYPSVLALSAYCSDAKWSCDIFAAPLPGGERPVVPWENGLVLAPELPIAGDEPVSFGECRARALDAIACLNHDYAADPDRLVAAGLSMGSALAYDIVERHPDRFAALGDVSGGCPQQPEPDVNLKTVRVYIQHGEKDDDVPIVHAYNNDRRWTEIGVEHVLDVLPEGGHAWPEKREDGDRVSLWLHASRRNAWPKELSLIFPSSESDPKRRIYWLEMPDSAKNRLAAAKVEGNTITLDRMEGFAKVTLWLGEPLVDLDQEVIVRKGDKELFRGKLARSWSTLLADFEKDGWDSVRAAPCKLEVPLTK